MTKIVSTERLNLSSKTTLFIVGLFLTLVLLSSGQTAYAAPRDNSGGTGNFTRLELAKNAYTFAYAKPGEYIHFRVSPGERRGNAGDDCATVSIQNYQGTILTNGGNQRSTCNSGSPTTVTLVYRVPTNGSAVIIDEPSKAYVAVFDTRANDNASDPDTWNLIDAQDDSQGYEWRVWVSSYRAGNNQIHGRVWFDGSIGLKTWQNPDGDRDLTRNNADFSFRYVRKDGYRYDMTYKDYQGIWSEFYGGIYGSARNAGLNPPAYTSFYKYYTGLNISGVTATNKAYVFIDCDTAQPLNACPSEVPGFDANPITGSGTGVDTTGAANPIEKFDSSRTSTDTAAFRYTGYPSGQLTGGRVYIPYAHMQSGLIRMQVWRGARGTGTLLCQKDFRINSETASGVAGPNANGSNAYTWAFTGARDTSCDSGTLAASAVSLGVNDSVTFSAQAVHLGEMHFITADTERLGGVTVKGNGLSESRRRFDGRTTDTSTWIAWNDPFSRQSGDVCGSIPLRVADGGASTGSNNWDSVSSGRGQQPGGAIYTISAADRAAANSGRAADKWRLPTDSNISDGVHGWLPASSGCNWTADSNSDGTAGTDSTWGNKRNIENWAYAYIDPVAKTFTIGGSSYELTPHATALPNTLSLNQSATFVYSVENNRSSSNATAWSMRSVVIAPGTALPNDYLIGFDGSARTCASYYNRPGVTCDENPPEAGSTGTGTFPGTSIGNQTIPQSYPPGTRICRSLTVDSYNQDSPSNPRTSALSCATIGVVPSLQVWGNDVRVGSGFVTGDDENSSIRAYLTLKDGNYRGSWGEYGVLAPAAITNFASGSGLNTALTTSNPADWSKLTFANTSLAGTMGNFASSDALGQIPDVKTYLTNAAAKAGLTIKVRNGLTTIDNGYEPNTVYIVNGDVTIKTDDIRNTSPATGVSSLTQMIIIANNINIDPGITQIDAWLITPGGTINTCQLNDGVGDQRLSMSVCNQFLKINGPLMADTVLPRRTSGEGSNPAEVLNLRGDAYMWARKVSEANGSIHTTYLRELPPRY